MINIVDNKQTPVGEIFHLLGDPTRRQIVELLAQGPRPAGAIHAAFPIAAPAVSRHLRLLREAGLVDESSIPGDKRVRLYGLRPERLEAVLGWIERLELTWQRQLESFKDYAELRSGGRE